MWFVLIPLNDFMFVPVQRIEKCGESSFKKLFLGLIATFSWHQHSLLVFVFSSLYDPIMSPSSGKKPKQKQNNCVFSNICCWSVAREGGSDFSAWVGIMQTWIPVSAQCGIETCFQAAVVWSPSSWVAQRPGGPNIFLEFSWETGRTPDGQSGCSTLFGCCLSGKGMTWANKSKSVWSTKWRQVPASAQRAGFTFWPSP